jgi:hypothetical protein
MGGEKTEGAAELVEVRKIWDRGKHNAFTDLIRFRDRWWCCFREADAHVGGDGQIRVLESADGKEWQSAALLSETGVDLRDPKFCITPDNRLMLALGGSVYGGTTKLKARQPRVAFSADGRAWSAPQLVLSEGDWLWRVTWHEGRAYGVSYKAGQGGAQDAEWSLKLYSSPDGIMYEELAALAINGRPNETTLRFLKTGQALALVRREAGSKKAWLGSSNAPYREWQWRELQHQIGGPNFIELPDGALWASGRSYPGGPKCVVAKLTPESYDPVLTLPSGGDCSYPGLVWHDGLLWVSYYSSHEGKSAIYLARIKLAGAK